MAFVIETISDEAKSALDYDVFYKGGGISKRPIEVRKWVIDHKRNTYMVWIGIQYGAGVEAPDIFAISIDGQGYRFEAFKKAERVPDGDLYDYFYHIVKFPSNLAMEDKPNFCVLVREGFEAMGSPLCDTSRIRSIKVTFKE